MVMFSVEKYRTPEPALDMLSKEQCWQERFLIPVQAASQFLVIPKQLTQNQEHSHFCHLLIF